MTSLDLIAIAEALPGVDLPGMVVSNQMLSDAVADFARIHGVDVELPDPRFPEERVGVLKRRFLDHRYSSNQMAEVAATRAFALAGLHPEEVKAVIVTTVTSPQAVPATAAMLHDKLGLGPEVSAFDTPIGCNGFLGGLKLAQALLNDEQPGSCALLVTTEAMSRVLQATDRQTSVIFGDGAAATVLRKVEQSGLGQVSWFTQGRKAPLITIVPGPGPTYRFHVDDLGLTLQPDPHSSLRVCMNGRQVFRDMVTDLPRRIASELSRRDLSLDDFDLFAFHQANQRIVDSVASQLKLPASRLFSNIQDLGNTTSASIPLLLGEAARHGRLGAGARVMLLGFGTGYSVGVADLTWSSHFKGTTQTAATGLHINSAAKTEKARA